MKQLNLEEVVNYIESNIVEFHKKRLNSLHKLKLETVLKKKNPYLFKAKYLLTADTIVRSLTDAFISSNEETIFGDWLEGLAIFINKSVYGGWKSSTEGIDLEFDKDGKRYIVAIKSGPNWGNSSQVNKLKENFNKAAKILRTSSSGLSIVAVNGCCYGRNNKPDQGSYFKYCGQRFWEFISGNNELYLEIVKPLGSKAKEKSEEYTTMYQNMFNLFVKDFINKFCNEDGSINWEKLVKFNSGI
jgi:hypothetical protein